MNPYRSFCLTIIVVMILSSLMSSAPVHPVQAASLSQEKQQTQNRTAHSLSTAAYPYPYPAPYAAPFILTDVTPLYALVSQETEITILGYEFPEGISVYLGALKIAKVERVNGTRIKASLPQGMAPEGRRTLAPDRACPRTCGQGHAHQPRPAVHRGADRIA